jgi:branched-chain amino acid transport system ATP-binding protein
VPRILPYAARINEPPALALDRLTYSFGSLVAVREVSIAVPAGARHGIIGPNGAGKTTLFNLVSGELKATRGRIDLFGREITRVRAARRVGLGLGRTYQLNSTFSTMTVRENLALGAFGARPAKYALVRRWRADRDV